MIWGPFNLLASGIKRRGRNSWGLPCFGVEANQEAKANSSELAQARRLVGAFRSGRFLAGRSIKSSVKRDQWTWLPAEAVLRFYLNMLGCSGRYRVRRLRSRSGAFALAIPSTVFCRGDSICWICPTGVLTFWFSQPVSNKMAKNIILNIGTVESFSMASLQDTSMHIVASQNF